MIRCKIGLGDLSLPAGPELSRRRLDSGKRLRLSLIKTHALSTHDRPLQERATPRRCQEGAFPQGDSMLH